MQGVSLIPTWTGEPVREFIVAEHQPLLLEAEWFVKTTWITDLGCNR